MSVVGEGGARSPQVADSARCAQASGGPVTVSVNVVFDTVQEELMGRMDGQLAALPARPGVRFDSECECHLCLSQIQHGPQVGRIGKQLRPRGWRRAANFDGHIAKYTLRIETMRA